jgi:hypothetical protein
MERIRRVPPSGRGRLGLQRVVRLDDRVRVV